MTMLDECENFFPFVGASPLSPWNSILQHPQLNQLDAVCSIRALCMITATGLDQRVCFSAFFFLSLSLLFPASLRGKFGCLCLDAAHWIDPKKVGRLVHNDSHCRYPFHKIRTIIHPSLFSPWKLHRMLKWNVWDHRLIIRTSQFSSLVLLRKVYHELRKEQHKQQKKKTKIIIPK